MTTNNTDWNSLLDTVKDLSESYLRSFAADPAFDDKMILAFGKTSSKLGADWLASQVALPDIEVSSVESLNGAYGAFSPDTGKIYLSEELLESNFQALIAAVFLEEYGHFIDAQLNTEDFPGDEGAIFSSLVRGKELSIDRLQQLKTENDRSVAVVGEDFIEIEQATVSDSGGFEGSQQTLQLESNGGGIAEYEFEFYFIPDQFIIRYEGQELVNTGFIGGSRSGQVEIPEGNSDKLEVIVATNDEGTAWDYTVNTSAKGINIEDAEVEVEGGSNSRATISFTVTLSEASSVETTVRYFTLVGTAVDGITGSDRPDYRPVTGTLTFAPGQTTKDIEITVLGDTPVNYGSDANFEIFARDIAYRDWTGKEEQDIDDGSNLYGDLGYRVDQFFNDPSTGFQAVGLNSDEKFFVLISDPTNAEIFRDSQGERERLLTELADALGGDTNSSAYVQALEEIDKLQSEDASWTFATGTIYDSGKDPVLAIRGTEPDQLSTDVFDDANPSGIGFAQFTQNSSSVSEWLQAVSNPEDTTFSFEPHITGHSLGGALTQWFASDYSRFGDLGDIVTFNAPGISDSRANSFNAGKAGDVTHYITSNDIVSMAGNEYISGGYVLSNQDEVPSTFPNPLNAHLHPVIISTIALSGLNRPTGLTSDAIKPSSILSDDFFTYLPDVDYFAIQLIIAGLGAGLGTIVPGATVGGAYVASALSARITTEANRALIGAVIYSIDYALEFASEVIQAALNAAIRWGTVAFDAISQWGEDAWNAVSNWTNDAWNATEQWVNDAWSATTQWTSDAWNATTQWTSDAWNATTQWTS
ncbi:MAG: Calx-beta domain-containing protein, partial [Prochlorotrichaceae cyanobacterium]